MQGEDIVTFKHFGLNLAFLLGFSSSIICISNHHERKIRESSLILENHTYIC